MGRKRASPQLEAAAAVLSAAAGNQVLDDEDLEAAEISEDVLEGLRRLDQGGNRVTWYVYSDTPGKSGDSEGYVEKLKTEHLDEQRFKTRYGPGEFRVMGRTSDGHYVKGSHKVIKISDIGAEAPAAARSTDNDAVTLMRELRTADDARQRARDESLKTYATILAAPLATLGAALIARRPAVDIAALVTALKPAQSAPTLADMTTALVNLKAVQGDGGGNNNIDMVLKVLERLPDLPQGTQGEGGWLGFLRDLIKEAAPHARELFAQRAAPQQGQLPPGATAGPAFGPGVTPGAVLPRPAPTNGASPPTPTASAASPPSSSDSGTNPNEASDMWRIAEPWLRRRAEDLHEWAAANLEVPLCAEMLLASVPKLFRAALSAAELHAFLQRPDWWGVLTAFHPPLHPYQAWIDDLRVEVSGLLVDEINGVAPDTGADDRGTTQ
jgi:hypothetical protein